jgi:hypothetical protein
MDVLVMLGVLGVLGVLALLVVRQGVEEGRAERRRRELIRRWAADHGWTVTERPAVDWAARLPAGGVDLLVSGMTSGRPVGVAEYSESTNDGPIAYIVTTVRLAVPYPPVAVVSRCALSRLGRAVFGDNTTATGHDAFDRRFRVQTRDPALARTLLGPGLIAEHLAGRVPTWRLAAQDLLSCRYDSHSIEDPDQIATLAASLVRVAELLGR